MTSAAWTRTILVAAVLLVIAAGCASQHVMALSDVPSGKSSDLSSRGGLQIEGYSTRDSVFHGFDGLARWTSANHDSLELTGRHTSDVHSPDVSDKKTVTLRLAASEIATLVYRGSTSPKSPFLGFGLFAVILVGVLTLGVVIFYPRSSD